jgi:arylsulfatase A-like enzyme
MMDDMGYGDLGSYGAPHVRTPNIDRLAREGVRLTDAYANGPACTPTRAALISGRYQQHVGLEWALTNSPADRELGLPALGASLPALLKSNGYATGRSPARALDLDLPVGPGRGQPGTGQSAQSGDRGRRAAGRASVSVVHHAGRAVHAPVVALSFRTHKREIDLALRVLREQSRILGGPG